MPISAALRPMPSQITSNASRPIAGVACPMLANAIAAGVARRNMRRVSRMPSGIAMISTKNVEIAVSSMCCHSALVTCPSDSALRVSASSSACSNHSHVAISTAISTSGRKVSFCQVTRECCAAVGGGVACASSGCPPPSSRKTSPRTSCSPSGRRPEEPEDPDAPDVELVTPSPPRRSPPAPRGSARPAAPRDRAGRPSPPDGRPPAARARSSSASPRPRHPRTRRAAR